MAGNDITFVLGAGATIPYMDDITTKRFTDIVRSQQRWESIINKFLYEVHQDHDIPNVNTEELNRYAELIEENRDSILQLISYLSDNTKNISFNYFREIDFEIFIHLIDETCDYLSACGGDFYNPEMISTPGGLSLVLSRFTPEDFLTEEDNGEPDSHDSIPVNGVHYSIGDEWELVPNLAREIIATEIIHEWRNSDTDYQEGIKSYHDMISQCIGTGYRTNIFSLNYDPLIFEALKSIDEIDTGFKSNNDDENRFRPGSFLNSNSSLGFPHGHLGFYPPLEKEVPRSFTREFKQLRFTEDFEWAQIRRMYDMPLEIRQDDDVMTRNSCLATGMYKSGVFTRNPYAAYFQKLNQSILKSNKLIFIGFSFGDPHLQSYLRNYLFEDDSSTDDAKEIIIVTKEQNWKQGISQEKEASLIDASRCFDDRLEIDEEDIFKCNSWEGWINKNPFFIYLDGTKSFLENHFETVINVQLKEEIK